MLGALLKNLDLAKAPEESRTDGVDATANVWGYTIGVILWTVTVSIVHPITFFTMYQASYRIRVVLTMLIYDKVCCIL